MVKNKTLQAEMTLNRMENTYMQSIIKNCGLQANNYTKVVCEWRLEKLSPYKSFIIIISLSDTDLNGTISIRAATNFVDRVHLGMRGDQPDTTTRMRLSQTHDENVLSFKTHTQPSPTWMFICNMVVHTLTVVLCITAAFAGR